MEYFIIAYLIVDYFVSNNKEYIEDIRSIIIGMDIIKENNNIDADELNEKIIWQKDYEQALKEL